MSARKHPHHPKSFINIQHHLYKIEIHPMHFVKAWRKHAKKCSVHNNFLAHWGRAFFSIPFTTRNRIFVGKVGVWTADPTLAREMIAARDFAGVLTLCLAFHLAYILTFYLAFYLVLYLTSGAPRWGPTVPTDTSRLVWQCPLKSGVRGWGPAVPTDLWSSRLGSGSASEICSRLRSDNAYWNLTLAVEVWQCLLCLQLAVGELEDEEKEKEEAEDGYTSDKI